MNRQTKQTRYNDTEFRHLSPGLPPADYALLEEQLRTYGCLTPLLVWNGRIIDGHLRYDICRKYDIPFEVSVQSFPGREDAVCHICQAHLEKDFLPAMFRRYLIGTFFTAAKNIAYRDRTRRDPSSPHPRAVIGARLGAACGMSMHTVYKAGTLAAAIDRIRSLEPELANGILDGRIAISYENAVVFAKLSKEQLKHHTRRLADSQRGRLTRSDLSAPGPHAKRMTERSAEKKADAPAIRTAIKEMPAYDPDAGMQSLRYTIPSWIGSIERTFAQSDLSAVSPETYEGTGRQLALLSETVNAALRAMAQYAPGAASRPAASQDLPGAAPRPAAPQILPGAASPGQDS